MICGEVVGRVRWTIAPAGASVPMHANPGFDGALATLTFAPTAVELPLAAGAGCLCHDLPAAAELHMGARLERFERLTRRCPRTRRPARSLVAGRVRLLLG